jgi:EAL domain-containing protein (putative c-di-GMP-specific phosphodiesterase class I)
VGERLAVDRGQINVMFQPIVRLEDRTVAGFEALPRWRHPRLGLLGPADFYALADASDSLVEIGVFAIETAARELAAWQKALEVTPPIFASINVSARQLLGHDLLSDVRTALNRHYVLRGTLKLELAESLVMENPEYALQLLRRIRELGAGLALDDFGAGYTSLSHLQRYRFDTLKVDPSLVRPNGNGGRPAILRSVIAMAHDLGMDVITEGAETESDAVELSQMGCEFAQGYAFGEPMSAASARKLMGAEPL